MNITDYADILNIEINVKYYPNQKNRWSASFHNAEMLEGSILISEYGNGSTPESAIEDYINIIKGKRLVFNAGGGLKYRREYDVPEGLVL